MKESLRNEERKRQLEPIDMSLDQCSRKLRRLNLLATDPPRHPTIENDFEARVFGNTKNIENEKESTALVLYKEPAPVSETSFRITMIRNHPNTTLGHLLRVQESQMEIESQGDNSKALTIYTPIEDIVEKALEIDAHSMIG
jgi:hypothetical protein